MLLPSETWDGISLSLLSTSWFGGNLFHAFPVPFQEPAWLSAADQGVFSEPCWSLDLGE